MTKAAELAKMGEVLTNSQISGRRNIIINGGMQVSQRATSSSNVGSAAGYFTLDRFNVGINGTTAGRFTMSQSTDTPDGFTNSMKIDVTTADTSIASDESVGVLQRIEGLNVQSLAKGTSAAKKSTFSFYAKGTAKTFIVEFQDDNSRRFSRTFTTTTSWQRFTIDVPADTTGEIDNDITTGLTIIFWFHAGSDYTSGTLQTTWGGTTSANRMVGCQSLFDSTDNELYITGVQLEVGSVATPFEHRTLAEELLLCQRYYQKFTFTYFNLSRYYHNTGARLNDVHFYTEMRDTPVGTNSGTFTSSTGFAGNPTIYNTFTGRSGIGAGSGSANSVIYLNSGSDAFLQMDAEL
tara:strand:+ start:105 stop:1154 length:1050 start_codon:yes stop_codon:yes gene_type:complete